MSLDRMKEIRNFIKIANEDAAKEYVNSNDCSEYHKGIFTITLNSLGYIDYLISKEKRDIQSKLSNIKGEI